MNTFGPRFFGGEKRGYHHGHLKEALLEAARYLAAERGPSGFTLAEAAKMVGVTPAAPYRHFRDRDTLLADVARRGFELFAERLAAAWDEGKPTPLPALQRLGRAYLDFARAEPAYYAAMFEAGLPIANHADYRAASEKAFGILKMACDAVVAAMPQATRPPAMMMALHIWSLSHGVASLFARGDSARRPLPMPAEDLLEAGVMIYLDGLGARPE